MPPRSGSTRPRAPATSSPPDAASARSGWRPAAILTHAAPCPVTPLPWSERLLGEGAFDGRKAGSGLGVHASRPGGKGRRRRAPVSHRVLAESARTRTPVGEGRSVVRRSRWRTHGESVVSISRRLLQSFCVALGRLIGSLLLMAVGFEVSPAGGLFLRGVVGAALRRLDWWGRSLSRASDRVTSGSSRCAARRSGWRRSTSYSERRGCRSSEA